MGNCLKLEKEYKCGPKHGLADYYKEIKKDVKIKHFNREKNIFTIKCNEQTFNMIKLKYNLIEINEEKTDNLILMMK
jgi:hypothetical protein